MASAHWMRALWYFHHWCFFFANQVLQVVSLSPFSASWSSSRWPAPRLSITCSNPTLFGSIESVAGSSLHYTTVMHGQALHCGVRSSSAGSDPPSRMQAIVNLAIVRGLISARSCYKRPGKCTVTPKKDSPVHQSLRPPSPEPGPPPDSDARSHVNARRPCRRRKSV
jgi:hypothetical protein